MKSGPDIASLASLLGDPARSNMLIALMSGKALTATELATEAGITPQTASSHLARLKDGGLVTQRKQGRNRFFTLADEDVAGFLETFLGFAAKKGQTRFRTGPKEPALRKARVCYNHLAGEMGVRMYEAMLSAGQLVARGETILLSPEGRQLLACLGIDEASLAGRKQTLCKPCLDWSERKSHLAGSLGKALLESFYAKGWAKRVEGTRIISFTPTGEAEFARLFP